MSTSVSAPADTAKLLIRELSKVYRGGVAANDGLSLEVRPGEVFGLLGPNGAGKTTLVNQIIGLLAPTSGSIELDGIDLVRNPAIARQLCSYLPQGQLPIESLTVRQAVELTGRVRGGSAKLVRRRMDEMIAQLELEEWADTLGAKVSGGVRRLVGFLMATVVPGRVVILDEPTNDVDPLRRRLLWRRIRELGERGVAVLLVTHNVLEAERAVDRLAIIDRGRIRSEGTPAAMKVDSGGRLRLQLTLEPGASETPVPGFGVGQTRIGRKLLVALDEPDVLTAIEWARDLMRQGVAEEYELGAATLEDAYLRRVGRQDAVEMEAGNGDNAIR